MPLDEFKTQVLLLHSEESTLQQLSSGFGDDYTVHCATSGSEALNTLVETPIDVMVSAQNLPGMSGLDALREAKKRSPNTLGILIAGSAYAELEALVSDKEVFQIVRGTVTAEALLLLVENATQQMRLMTLAKSANDTTANVDRPVTEHIIMETSENGSAIISDGTGRMPALDPQKVSAAASVGSRAVDILVLTKDEEFLETIKDSARGMHKVHYANSLAQADAAIRKFKIGVAVVDAAMIGRKVEQLTQHLRRGVPRLVSIVAGRRADGDMLMDLINRGKVYRFLLKPVSPGRARLAVEASVKHHLEAPNVAFGTKGAADSARQAPRAATKARKTPKAVPLTPKRAPTPRDNTPADPPLGSAAGPVTSSLLDRELASAFGEDSFSPVRSITSVFGSIREIVRRGKNAAAAVGSLLLNPRFLGLGAVTIVALAGTWFWFASGPGEMPLAQDVQLRTPTFTEVDVIPETSQPVTDTRLADVALGDEKNAEAIDALLKKARSARNAGQIVDPVGSNAIDLYAAAVLVAPENELVANEFDAVITQALGMAESALLESRLDDADAVLQRVTGADADNPRLPFLTAQLSQVRLRGYLDQARIATRENRFEDAAIALSVAHGLITTDDTEINAVADELSAARSAQQVDDVLARANARLENGDLLAPPNDNARYYYELVLSAEPDNTTARQGLTVIASKLVLQARAEVDNGYINAAEDSLAAARAIDPSNSELTAVTDAVSRSRAELAAQQRQVEVEREEAERRVEVEREEAERRVEVEHEEVERQATTTPDAGDQGQDGDAVISSTQSDVGVEQYDANTADMVTVPEAEVELPQPLTAEETAIAVRNATPIGVSTLSRTRYVAPKYPRVAQRRNLSGWVDVTFTVAMDGTVKDIEAPRSEPDEIFVQSAMRAVEKWEFEPVVDNGTIVEKRAGVRLMFALE
ncbi:MAG: TonB family protein [Proteobacteria bacterium]|nr:TonB family protein [Pseudomonadota bacterium]